LGAASAHAFPAETLAAADVDERARMWRQGWARGETFRSTVLGRELELAGYRKQLTRTAGV
jgi:hypothetical protein